MRLSMSTSVKGAVAGGAIKILLTGVTMTGLESPLPRLRVRKRRTFESPTGYFEEEEGGLLCDEPKLG